MLGEEIKKQGWSRGMLPWHEQSLQPKGCPGLRLQCGCRRRWFVTAALAPHLKHWDYPRVSSGHSILAVGVRMALPGRDCWHCSERQQWCSTGGAKEAFGETSTSLPHFDAILDLQAEICRGRKGIKNCGFNRVWGICSKKPCSSTSLYYFPFLLWSSRWFDFAKYFSTSLIVGQAKFPVLVFQ